MNTNFHIYYFSLDVDYLDCQVFYTGQLQHAVLMSDEGYRVQIPVVNLRRYIDSRGLKGRFRLLTDLNHKIVSFERVI